MRRIFFIIFCFQCLLVCNQGFPQVKTRLTYVDTFSNTGNPQIAYWFLTPAIVKSEAYLPYLDTILEHSLFDFIFLDAREGCSFDSLSEMHKVVADIVTLAHKRHIKIGLRMRPAPMTPLPESLMERFIAEGEMLLDSSGKGTCSMNAGFVRSGKPVKKEVYKVFVFKKTGDGFYEEGSLQESKQYMASYNKDTVVIHFKGGKALAGYTVYAMSEFYFNIITNHSGEVLRQTSRFIDSYGDIPLDGIMLDEYSNPRLLPSWLVPPQSEGLRLRSYSLPMAKELETMTAEPAAATLFAMRYAPEGRPDVRIKAINTYMDLMRSGAMRVENTMYEKARKVFGHNCFIGAHNTYHNSLINDEIWATGVKWWSLPRDYGFTDEKTTLPTQVGVAMSYPGRIMYNMYYDKDINDFANKTLTDLRYGIRTFYHAFNDTRWGIGLEQPKAYKAITSVENCARLLNWFNPSLPEAKLLVIFGNEALQNWYPHKETRGIYDINDKLDIEEKALQIRAAGYMNALVPSDLINEGKLTLNADQKPVLNGHVFDAVIFLYPQYAKEPVISFLEKYVRGGGKLMLEGEASYDFSGKNIAGRIEKIRKQAKYSSFSIERIPGLGIQKNTVEGGCKNEDGSFVFTDNHSLNSEAAASFSITGGQNTYVGHYKGLAAIQLDEKGNLLKLAAGGFSSLTKNGKEILHLTKAADIFLVRENGKWDVRIADTAKSDKLIITEKNEIY